MHFWTVGNINASNLQTNNYALAAVKENSSSHVFKITAGKPLPVGKFRQEIPAEATYNKATPLAVILCFCLLLLDLSGMVIDRMPLSSNGRKTFFRKRVRLVCPDNFVKASMEVGSRVMSNDDFADNSASFCYLL